MACALPLLLGRVAPSSHRLLRTCVCLLSFFLTYVCYCALFSSNAAMQHAAGLAPNCRRVPVDGGKRRLQKSTSCVSTFGGRENERALMIPSQIATTRNSTRSLATGVKFGNKKLPNAIIVGVKKGGTRAVLEFIRIHPDVRAVGTETHFFDRNYDKGLDWYRSLMPRTLSGQITMEKTPSYFVTREVPRRISAMSRGTKLIVVVRDPVTRAISDYTQTLSKSPDLPSFQELAFLLNRSLGATAMAAGTQTPMVDTSWNAIQIGLYALHLENWLRFFPREQMHFVSGEQLIADPAGELARLQDFLGLRRVVTDKHFFFNRTKGFPCLKKPESGGGGAGGSPPRCLGKSKGRPHVQIDRDVLEQLRDFYRPHNVRFYEMVGHDFRWE